MSTIDTDAIQGANLKYALVKVTVGICGSDAFSELSAHMHSQETGQWTRHVRNDAKNQSLSAKNA